MRRNQISKLFLSISSFSCSYRLNVEHLIEHLLPFLILSFSSFVAFCSWYTPPAWRFLKQNVFFFFFGPSFNYYHIPFDIDHGYYIPIAQHKLKHLFIISLHACKKNPFLFPYLQLAPSPRSKMSKLKVNLLG